MTKQQNLDLLELRKEIRTRKSLKRKNQFKIIFKLCIYTGIVVFILSIFAHSKAFGNCELNSKTISISSNDTLWTIAKNEKENNKYFRNKDIREVIYEIKCINNLESSNIIEGQEIQIPVYIAEN